MFVFEQIPVTLVMCTLTVGMPVATLATSERGRKLLNIDSILNFTKIVNLNLVK